MQSNCNAEGAFLDFPGIVSEPDIRSILYTTSANGGEETVVSDFSDFAVKC